MRHIVGLSGGKDSSAMALRLRELNPSIPYEFVCTPTSNELPAMFLHWRRLGDLLGSPIIPVTNGTLKTVIIDENCIPNHRMRFCTRILKIVPFQTYLLNASPAVSYVGIRADEVDAREGVDHGKMDGITNEWPLVTWGWGLAQVVEYLEHRGVVVPERTDCAWCFFQRLSEWWRLWKNHRELFLEAEDLETKIGYTFRSAERDTWPASLRELRAKFESGLVPKGADQLTMKLGVSERPRMCSVCAR